MKAPPFEYIKPAFLAEVFPLLEQYGDDARILAGGQTLMATLNMRLSEPQLLIDIGSIDGLRGISQSGDGISIGAMTRHSEIEDSPVVAEYLPLLSMAAPHVGHRAIRNRGTLGGSLAFSDPAAEWPACVVALDATIVLAGKGGERRVKAGEFFIDLYTTAMQPDEIIKACEFPLPATSARFAFLELARRHGDYAIVGLAAAARVNAGALTDLHLVFLGTGNTPMRARAAEAQVEGKLLDSTVLESAKTALASELLPVADLYNGAQTKLHLAGVLMGRALKQLLV